MKEEIRRAVKKKQLNEKHRAVDNVAVELVKFGREMTLNKLHIFCTEVWDTGIWLEDWTQSVFIPLPKKGDLLQCINYRTITLVSNASKIRSCCG